MTYLNELQLEIATIDYFRKLGNKYAHCPEIAPDGDSPEHEDYSQVILTRRLRQALVELNSDLPAEAIEEAYRQLTRPKRPLLIANNHALHSMLVDRVAYNTTD